MQDRTVVRPEMVSELRSINTDHLDSREVNDIECRALAMLRDHSLLPTRNSRKSNKSKPCRQDEHDTRTGKPPERPSNLTDDRVSSDDGPDSPDPNTAAKTMDVEQIVSPGRAVTINRRSMSREGEKEEARDPQAGKEEEQKEHDSQHGKTWMKVMQMEPNFTMSIREVRC
ncbi:TPA: hypothetical protein ACH3X3_004907 [Trebouxia sp. C0006]